ncbi:diaminopimelate decarboxylase [Solitalea lacus]|uniref:diaminopimelate decarboxylase n=1 Tax=Solitalea lacus TaxID=2911172 RepID=UPI001EDC1DE5|nr:diaminopimelate decarboxylase [Solitalea lacus]UKJ05964.1 diaminopimelate decarboxylase [Solitalea lacus]
MFSQEQLNKFSTQETPFYYYDLALLRRTLEACSTASSKYNFHVHYAMKANVDPRVLDTIRSFKIGADCVSGGEVKKAIECGFTNDKVVFAGVGKSDPEINYALDQDIFCFNVESIQELEIINELALQKGKTAKVALRINPNVNAYTHKYITTGLEENKFGINQWEFEKVAAAIKILSNIECIGLHFHIGSQITDFNVFKSLCIKVNEIVNWFTNHHFNIKVINVGGGLGVDYYNPDTNNIVDFETYFRIFDSFLERSANQEVHFELGRALVANCGSLISRVLFVKYGQVTNFAILDAGMTELMRPALYQAYHKIENLSKDHNVKNKKYDVVGPICESTDCFGKAVELPDTNRGDLIAIRTAGAYGEVMASNYNLRNKVNVIYNE